MKYVLRLLVFCFMLFSITTITAAQQTNLNIRISYQPFERGHMIWRADTGHIWVFGIGGQLLNFPSSSYGRLPDNPIQGAPGQILPIFGFGKVWGNHQTVRDLVGFPTLPEGGGDATLQVISPANVIFLTYGSIFSVQIEPTGSWLYGGLNINRVQVSSLTTNTAAAKVGDTITINWQSNSLGYAVVEIYDASGKLIEQKSGQSSGSTTIIAPNTNKITVMVWATQLLQGATIASRHAYASTTINITGSTTISPTPPPNTSTCTSGSIYIVQRGDTLYRIARNCGVTIDALATRNNIVNRNRIFVGQRLIIP